MRQTGVGRPVILVVRDHTDKELQHCDYMTTQSVFLEFHSRELFVNCEHSDYTTTYSGNLNVYSRKHTAEILQCLHCNSRTTQSDYLINLIARNLKDSGEMFKCQHCDYTTAYFGSLKFHDQEHSREMLEQS